jgi:hypothetical protein
MSAKQMRRVRRLFAELLYLAVRETLDEPTPENINDELQTLGLLPYIEGFLPGDSHAPSDE